MKQGQCYRVAGLALIEGDAPIGSLLVHGFPRLQRESNGHPAGTRYGHAWLEYEVRPGVWVAKNFDPDVTLPRDLFYAMGQIEEKWVSRYSKRDAQAFIAETGRWGHWAAEEPPDTAWPD